MVWWCSRTVWYGVIYIIFYRSSGSEILQQSKAQLTRYVPRTVTKLGLGTRLKKAKNSLSPVELELAATGNCLTTGTRILIWKRPSFLRTRFLFYRLKETLKDLNQQELFENQVNLMQ